VAGFSPHHFSRLFTARFGISVMGYVREMRLLDAAVRLKGERPPALIDLAFDCGFESQEAFTRAFRRSFGVPPGQYRRDAPKPPNPERKSMSTMKKPRVELQKELLRRDGFTVAGVRAVFDDENKHGIPALWPRLIRALPLAGQVGPATYGVCSMVDKAEGSFSYMAGVEVAGEAPLPDGFERVVLAPQAYAVFRVVMDGTALHPQMQAAMPEIWAKLLPQSGLKTVAAPDLEYYPPGFEPNRNGAEVHIWVPVEG
jgi:AraC family transcriptional regulator